MRFAIGCKSQATAQLMLEMTKSCALTQQEIIKTGTHTFSRSYHKRSLLHFHHFSSNSKWP